MSKIILITGASTGLGAETARLLAPGQENTPLKRHGHAGHIAMAVKFLIENDFITGETVDINGGLFMR
jgi:3-oxoacyl-[acyl-carrier protein] reductase